MTSGAEVWAREDCTASGADVWVREDCTASGADVWARKDCTAGGADVWAREDCTASGADRGRPVVILAAVSLAKWQMQLTVSLLHPRNYLCSV